MKAKPKLAKYCSGCSKGPQNLLICNRCNVVYYCGLACQTKDWPKHKPHCVAPIRSEENLKIKLQRQEHKKTLKDLVSSIDKLATAALKMRPKEQMAAYQELGQNLTYAGKLVGQIQGIEFFNRGLVYLQKCLPLCISDSDRITTLALTGVTHSLLNNAKDAVVCFRTALSVKRVRQTMGIVYVMDIWTNLGRVTIEQDEKVNCFQKVAQLANDSPDEKVKKQYLLSAYSNLMQSYHQVDDMPKVKKYMDKIRAIDSGTDFESGMYAKITANVYVHENRLVDALRVARAHLQNLMAEDQRKDQIVARKNIALILTAMGNADEAKKESDHIQVLTNECSELKL